MFLDVRLCLFAFMTVTGCAAAADVASKARNLLTIDTPIDTILSMIGLICCATFVPRSSSGRPAPVPVRPSSQYVANACRVAAQIELMRRDAT